MDQDNGKYSTGLNDKHGAILELVACFGVPDPKRVPHDQSTLGALI